MNRNTLLLGVLSFATCLAQADTAGPAYTIIDLGTLGGTYSSANSINNRGQVVGGSHTAGGTYYRATLSSGTGSGNLFLGTLGGAAGEAYAINDSGVIVGDGPDILPNIEIISYGRNGLIRLQRNEQWEPGETLELGPLDQWVSVEGGRIEIRTQGRALAYRRF